MAQSSSQTGDAAPTDVGSQTHAAAPAAPLEPGDSFEAGPPAPDWARRPRPDRSLRDLPAYGQSLLKIELPVTVTLATSRRPIGQIVKLTPGSILQFNKSCDEPVELSIGNQAIAAGEAVKVGDKFGIRIASILLPEERFDRVSTVAKRMNPEP